MNSNQILQSISSPADLKNLSIKDLKVLSDDVGGFIRSTINDVGGHYSSPLGVVDLTVALHHIYDSPRDKIIWDIGHQAYAHKILTGRKDQFSTLRQKDGISGFLKRDESIHDIIGAGHASTAISAGLGIAHARDRNNKNEKVVVVIGDGGMTGGLAYEGLNNLGFHKTQMTVVLNDNSMSISQSVGALSHYLTRVVTNPTYNKFRNELWEFTGKIPENISRIVRKTLRKTEEGIKGFLTPGIFFEELGLRYIGPIPGHDMDELVRTFNSVKDFPNPTLVHVYSQKGKRCEDAEKDSVKFYSISGNKSNNIPEPAPSYSKVFGDSITQLAEENDKIYCITAAMEIGTGMSEFVQKFPERYIDVGIAEGHAMTYACGIAAGGLKPVIPIYSTFVQRAYDNIFHDLLLQNLSAVICMDRSGLVGPDGPTHHGVYDLAYLRTLPNLIISAPRNGDELKNLIATGLQLEKETLSIRYPKETSHSFDKNKKPEIIKIGSWETIRQGNHICILAVGSMVGMIDNNYDQIIYQTNVGFTLINARFIKPLDTDMLEEISKIYDYVITIEEGTLNGGFGAAVLEWAADNNKNFKVIRMGIPDKFIEHGSRNELLDEMDLTPRGVIAKIREEIPVAEKV